MSENHKEIEQVAALFPESHDYLNVYERSGIVGPKFTAGHAIHLSDDAWGRMSSSGSSISFCPSSNLFLGSGLFMIDTAKGAETPVPIGMGSDVGAGERFSILQVLNDGYKVSALRGLRLSAMKGLFLATLGGARALHLDQEIGSFDPGKYADLVVLNPRATPIMALRADQAMNDATQTAEEQALAQMNHEAFGLMTLGDDRAVEATWVGGEVLFTRTA